MLAYQQPGEMRSRVFFKSKANGQVITVTEPHKKACMGDYNAGEKQLFDVVQSANQSIRIFSQAFPDCCLAMISEGEPPEMRLVKASPDDERQIFWETPRYLYNRFNGEALVVTCLFEGDIALGKRAETDEQQWHIEAIYNKSIFRVVRNKFSNLVLECSGENYPLIQMPFHGGKSQLFQISKTKEGIIFYSALRPDCCFTVTSNDSGDLELILKKRDAADQQFFRLEDGNLISKENVISVNDVPGSYPKVQGKYGDDSEQWIIEESFGVRMAPAPLNLIIINDESDEEDGCPKIPKNNYETSPTGLNFPAPPLDLNLTPQEHKVLELLDEDLADAEKIAMDDVDGREIKATAADKSELAPIESLVEIEASLDSVDYESEKTEFKEKDMKTEESAQNEKQVEVQSVEKNAENDREIDEKPEEDVGSDDDIVEGAADQSSPSDGPLKENDFFIDQTNE